MNNDATTTLISPSRGWQMVNVRELWRFRELIYFFIWRDVKVRYKQTVLGAAWAVLQPALMMVVFTVAFGRLAKLPAGNFPYPLFVFAGLLPWNFFATAMANAGNSVVGSEKLITKIYFPRLSIPIAAVGAAMVDFIVALGLMIVLMIWYRVPPSASIVMLPVIFALIAVVATGVGTLLAALTVAYRDFRYVIPFLVQLWLFATPAIYMQPTQPPSPLVQAMIFANPMSGLVAAFRAAILGGPMPWLSLGISAITCVILLLAGCFYFRRVEDSFADVV